MDSIVSLRFKNFRSVGGKFAEVPFNELKGMTLIQGKNGLGKTTIISAIIFGIYGKNIDLKGSGKSSLPATKLINDITNKEMRVELEIKSNNHIYKIIRGLKPNLLEIYKDGKKLSNQSHIKYDQEFITETVMNGISYELFSRIVYLSNKATSIPFLYLTPLQRKEFIEDVLEVRILFQISEKAKKKRNQTKMDIKQLEQLIQQKKDALKQMAVLIKKQMDEATERKKKKDEITKELERNISQLQDEQGKIQDHVKDLKGKIKKLSEARIPLQSKLKEKEALQEEKSSLQMQIDSIQMEIRSQQQNLIQLQTRKETLEKSHQKYAVCGDCPTLQKIIDLNETGILQKDIIESQNTVKQLETDLQKVMDRIEDLQPLETEFDEIEEKISKLDQMKERLAGKIREKESILKALQDRITLYEEQKESLKEEIRNPDLTPLRKMKSELVDMESSLDMKLRRLESYETIYTVSTSDAVKASVFDVYIPVLKKYIKEFVGRFTAFDSASFEVDIDDSFNITFLKNRKESELFQLSEGQKGSINLAFTFAFQKLLELKGQVNLLMIDEILDISFDEDRLEAILMALKELSQTKDIFIISHNMGINLELFDQIIKVDMKGPFTEYHLTKQN